MQKNKLVHHTALIIPVAIQKNLQDFRREHDPAFERWMPHINLCFPFFPEQKFSQFRQETAKALGLFKSFKIQLDQICSFDHGKTAVIYLKPRAADNCIHRLHETIVSRWPDLLQKKLFVPHCTLGKCRAEESAGLIRKAQERVPKLEWQVKNLWLIARQKQGQFRKVCDISLSQ